MLPILFSDTGATSQDGSHSAIFRMQGPEGCVVLVLELQKDNFKLVRALFPWKREISRD